MGRRPRTGLSEAGYNADAVSWEESPHWRTPLTVPIDGGVRELCSKLVLLVGFGLMMLASGCGTIPPSAAGPARAVHFVTVNLSDCAWQITLTPTGGPVRVLHIAARESQELDLVGGSYGIEQTALNGSTGADSTRRFTIRLEPGQTYRWRLVTLLSAAANGKRRDTANDEHERER